MDWGRYLRRLTAINNELALTQELVPVIAVVVMGCGGGGCQVKNIFLYTGSVVILLLNRYIKIYFLPSSPLPRTP